MKKIPRIRSGHLRSDFDLRDEELIQFLKFARQVKAQPSSFRRSLSGCYLAWLTEKESLRTSITFQLAIKQLGGDSVTHVARLGERESVKDVASNLGQWVDVVTTRTYKQSTVESIAVHAGVPVINALSNEYHPCQALADLMTLQERFGSFRELVLCFVGDGNNVCNSLMVNAVRLGLHFRWAGPKKYSPNPKLVAELQSVDYGGSLELFEDPSLAVNGADAVYTDTWISMGQESETEERVSDFAPYQINPALFAKAKPEAVFMHCLPAHRGHEVTDIVIDGERSLVLEQAKNRLHAQKALLLMLLGK